MQTQKRTRIRKIELADAPDFSWPVNIRVRATTPTSARPSPLELPAGSDFLVDVTTEPHQWVAVKATTSALNSFAPGWRIPGGRDEGTEE
jgi:hypothetical protein